MALVYHVAAEVVKKVEAGGGVRAALYNVSCAAKLRPTVSALCHETLKHAKLLKAVLDDSKIAEKFTPRDALNPHLLLVLCYASTMGQGKKKGIKGDDAHVKFVKANRAALAECMSKL